MKRLRRGGFTMHRSLSVGLSIVLAALAVACGSPTGTSPSDRARAECERLCTLQMACGVRDCADCTMGFAGASAACADALHAYVDCYDAAECPTTGDGIPLECLDEVGAIQAPCAPDAAP
jgi:hypothetical protein